MTPQTATKPMLFDGGLHRVGAIRYTGDNGDAIARWAGWTVVCDAYGSHEGGLEVRPRENSSNPLFARRGDWIVHHPEVGHFPLDARIFIALYRIAPDVPEALQDALTSGGPYPIDRGPRPRVEPDELTTVERQFVEAVERLRVGYSVELQTSDIGQYWVWRGMDAYLLMVPVVDPEVEPGGWNEGVGFVEPAPTPVHAALRLIDLSRAGRMCEPRGDGFELQAIQ